MRLEIDTVNKTVVVLSHTSIKELVNELPKMLSNWEEYSIISKTDSSDIVYQYPLRTFNPIPVSPTTAPLFYTTCNIGVQENLPEWYNEKTILTN
jgi:hypothetical protein